MEVYSRFNAYYVQIKLIISQFVAELIFYRWIWQPSVPDDDDDERPSFSPVVPGHEYTG